VAGICNEVEKNEGVIKMTKDEMKNRISMALKDPILQQGFEIICKENAELKETLKTYNGCGDWDNDFHTCRVYLQHEELQMYIHQLTKAKEIIYRLMDIIKHDLKCFDTMAGLDIKQKAEQFLKEVENEEMAEEQIINKE
jgi:hypothetical protein